MYSNDLLWGVLSNYLWVFLYVCSLVFFGFLYSFLFLFRKNASLKLFCFFLTLVIPLRLFICSLFGWCALFCCLHVGGKKVFILVIRCICFRCLLKSIKSVSNSYCIVIAYISVSNRGPVITCGFD